MLSEQLMQQLNVMLGSRVLPATSRPRQQLLQRALRCIEQNLGNEGLNTEYLCAALNTSPRQLSRAFELEGIPPNRYIWDLRLKRCRQELIASPGASISDIAFRFGFNHSAHFSRSYKNCFGETPTETRQRAMAHARG
ncbi:Transcriptional activator FeaR [compost metagenome]